MWDEITYTDFLIAFAVQTPTAKAMTSLILFQIGFLSGSHHSTERQRAPISQKIMEFFEFGLGAKSKSKYICSVLGFVDTYCLCTSIILIDLLNDESSTAKAKATSAANPPHANACCSGTAYAIIDRLVAANNATINVVVQFIIINTGTFSMYISDSSQQLLTI